MLLAMAQLLHYTIFPLGDAAATIDFGNVIDESINSYVLALFHSLNENHIPGITELSPAYSSLTVYYDIMTVRKRYPLYKSAFDSIKEIITEKLAEPVKDAAFKREFVKIPVCYDAEFALDAEELGKTKNINMDDLIRIHTAKTYTVYMLGFLPGFTYMGKLDNEISMPRKVNPRPRVEAGSVGIAGQQTGIYPLPSPGGWQIIGRTPLRLFNADNNDFTLLKPGDQVQFYSISKDEFNSY
jgi:inhibitor of KinA